MPSYHDNKRGIVALISGCALFTVNDTLTKLTALVYPTGEVMFFRALVCLVLIGAGVVYAHGFLRIERAVQPMVILRALLDASANITFVLALSHMRIADLLAINLVSPLLLTMLLAFFFREPVGWRRWTAILVGFAGTLLIVKPSPASFNIWALVAFGSATSSALRDLATRRIDPSVPTLAISFVSVVAVAVTTPLMALVFEEDWSLTSQKYLIFIGVAALFLSAGSTFAVSAFRNVDISVVAPFRYSLLLWGALSGYFVFGEVSDVQSAGGSLLIAGSGLYSLHRERVRHRQVSAKTGIR